MWVSGIGTRARFLGSGIVSLGCLSAGSIGVIFRCSLGVVWRDVLESVVLLL